MCGSGTTTMVSQSGRLSPETPELAPAGGAARFWRATRGTRRGFFREPQTFFLRARIANGLATTFRSARGARPARRDACAHGRFRFALHLPAAGGSPAGFVDLALATDGERVGGNIVCDHRTGGDIGAVADANGSHQRSIAANKNTAADDGGIFGEAVIVAGDGSRADVGAGPDV